ncbi:hypothetical protein AWENTII_001985 [Aspergillus wentii]
MLHQILDRSVSNFKIQEAILTSLTEAAELASIGATDMEVEEVLWSAMETAVHSNLHFLLIIDGLERVKSSDDAPAKFYDRLQHVVAGTDNPSKLILFTRRFPAKTKLHSAQLLSMDANQTHEDMVGAVKDAMSYHAQYRDIEKEHLDTMAEEIVNRAQGSFVWAQQVVEFVARQKTLADMVRAAKHVPESLGALVDHHLHDMDLEQADTRALLGWMAAAERPLLIKEVQQLLSVDPTTPSMVFRLSSPQQDLFRPMSALIKVRDGFVAFKHPIIRHHIRERAEAVTEQTDTGKFPFSLKEANYDLLIRSIAWVKLTVKKDFPISFNKLNAEDRESLFDSHVLMEYTSRYWFSHLLSSSMATKNGTFVFTKTFEKAVPDSVLFSQIELTSRESQFSRSSILELYRLSADVRRAVLGERAKATLQSLIYIARAAHMARVTYANDHVYEAWTTSKALMGPANGTSIALAELLATTPIHEGRFDQTAKRRGEALETLTSMDWEKSPISFNQSLGYLALLVPMYKANDRTQPAYEMTKQFYQRSVQKYGAHSTQSVQAADFLTQNFDISETDDMSLELARSKYENMVRTLSATDERRISYTLYMARLYEDRNQPKNAEHVLSSLWAGLSSREAESTSTWDKKTKVALVYYQFLRRYERSEEAEVIVRDLSSDIEGNGVHSPDMVQRAQLLRNEAREMGLDDLERVLSILVWRFYKKTGQEYSHDAVTLAQSLTKDMMGTDPATSVTELSPSDRLLLHELMDSIASLGPATLSPSILTLCRSLATLHIRDEEWQAGSTCVWSVLKHAWPEVQDPESDSKFPSETAPHMANLALDLAYCLFRRLNVHDATVVYGNAFKASIIADRVAIPSVTAVVKTVVEFYETTFQFTKALALLHQVSEFFVSRLGESDKHSIDSLYHEGDLATRLEYRDQAQQSYNIIYKASIRGGKIGSTGVRAAVALITLYEQDKQWDSALEVYRHLWPTLVRFDERDGYDRALLEGLLEKTYTGYMAILGSTAMKAGYSERYQVATEHLRLCKKIHGAADDMTLKATLGLAEICEDSESHIDEAIQLYQHVLKVHEWVPASQASRSLPEMSHTLPITVKHKLAQLYLRKKLTSAEAGSLYQEELQLSKQQQGHSSTTTLLWLREVALMYAIKDSTESLSKGGAILHNHADEVIQMTDHHQTLVDRAHRLAHIYLETGYKDQGNSLIDEMHQNIIANPPSDKALGEHPPAVFVAAFEEVFRGKQSYSQILQQLSSESQMTGSFEKSLSSHDLVPTLAAGEQLHQIQTEQKRTAAAKQSRDKLYDYFCNSLSISQLKHKDVIFQFFNVCRREVQHEDYNINIITASTAMVKDLCDRSRFQDAADLTGAFHSFVHLTDGLHSYESIFTSIKLCLYLNGYQTIKCPDEKISQNMAFESKLFLQEIMTAAKQINIQFSELPFTELNDLVTVLGEHELFDDLESILTDLWTSRIVQRTWTLNVVVWIGRRLVETRFCRGNTSEAIHLGRDICYNLRQVWGNCDNVTLEMNKLLSGLYTASGNHAAAVSLHESALYELLNDGDAVNNDNARETASQHLTLLKHAQTRANRQATPSTKLPDALAIETITRQAALKFGLNPADFAEEADGEVGMWHRPRRFSLDVQEEEKHENHLRNSSGAAMLSGNAGAKRISIAAL